MLKYIIFALIISGVGSCAVSAQIASKGDSWGLMQGIVGWVLLMTGLILLVIKLIVDYSAKKKAKKVIAVPNESTEINDVTSSGVSDVPSEPRAIIDILNDKEQVKSLILRSSLIIVVTILALSLNDRLTHYNFTKLLKFWIFPLILKCSFVAFIAYEFFNERHWARVALIIINTYIMVALLINTSIYLLGSWYVLPLLGLCILNFYSLKILYQSDVLKRYVDLNG